MVIIPTNSEIVGLFILLICAVAFLCVGLLRHSRRNAYASDTWTERHIDKNGQYRY